jgi:DNA-binding HxlR family transcriptional regulator
MAKTATTRPSPHGEQPGPAAAPGAAVLEAREAPIERVERAALDLDRLIHERMRLGIVSALAVNERLTFNDLKGLLRTTDGNLSVHARKLEEAGYVHCDKSFVGRLPKTEYRLTSDGKRALERYLDHMEAIIHATRTADADNDSDAAGGAPQD